MIKKEEEKTFYYVYKIVNKINNKIYVGCHETNDIDDGYMGSGKYILRAYKKYGMDVFYKEIISFHKNRNDMFEAESKIVTKEFIEENTNYNLAEGGKGGYRGESCYSSKERSEKLKTALKGMVSAKDSNNNFIKTFKNDIRLQTKELVGITKGLAIMKNKEGQPLQVDVNDPRIKTGELVGITKGSKQTKESNIKRSLAQKGIKKPKPYYTCPFCGKKTILVNIIRWHKKCQIETKNDPNVVDADYEVVKEDPKG